MTPFRNRLFGMRFQLLLGFCVVIAVVMLTSWWLAVRNTDAEFAILVSDANQRQAQLLAPTLLNEYQRGGGNWGLVQARLMSEMRQQNQLQFDSPHRAPFYRDGGVISFSVGELLDYFNNDRREFWSGDFSPLFSDNFNRWEIIIDEELLDLEPPTIEFSPNFDGDGIPDQVFVIPPNERQSNNATVVIGSPGLQWLVGNLMVGEQRILVLDTDGEVVVDTERDLLGRRIEDRNQTGVELYAEADTVGTLIVTSPSGVYTLEQSSFLQKVRNGFLYSGMIATAIAFVLSVGIAYQVTRPVKLLKAAASRIRQGDWGYQVPYRAPNEMGDLANAFNDMSHHLAEQRALRSRLVDDLAHELNTPLSLMRLELQGMADGLQSPAEAAQHLQQELDEVAELVNDLIFLASSDNAPTPQMEALDLNMIAQQVINRYEVRAEGRPLIFEPAPSVARIDGDSVLIQRAIGNLISNALRHTLPQDKITIRTEISRNHVLVYVTDTGEGIAADHLPHIFERFYRADSSRNRQSGGRGLGLAIVKQIMEQHGGTVTVESQPGLGSTFTLRFPRVVTGTVHYPVH